MGYFPCILYITYMCYFTIYDRWDYVHEISLPFLNFVETFLATYDTTVVSVEAETVIVVPVPSM